MSYTLSKPLISRLYTKFVSVSKVICALVVVLLVAALIIVPLLRPVEKRFTLGVVKEGEQSIKLDDLPIMKNPHFQGIDSNGQPYNVLAGRAIQKDKNTVMLESINADITMKSGIWLSLVANHGVINLEQKHLELTGQVGVFSDEGYEFRTENLRINLAEGVSKSETPVEVQGPWGTLESLTFESQHNGDILLFKGSVRVVMYLQAHEVSGRR